MEDRRNEAIIELENKLSELKSKVEDLERKVNEYRNLFENALQQDDAEVIDLGNEDFLGSISEISPEPAPDAVQVNDESVPEVKEEPALPAEDAVAGGSPEMTAEDAVQAETGSEAGAGPEQEQGTEAELETESEIGAAVEAEPESEAEDGTEAGQGIGMKAETEPKIEAETEPEAEETETAPAADMPEDLPEDLPADDEDGSESLFAGLFDEPVPVPEKKHQSRNLNDMNASRAGKAVIDLKSDKPAWMKDIPGPEVKDIRSAISLNDRVMFISSLFREDSMLFQDTIAKINGMTSLDKVITYMRETFPEWDMNSDNVYRFMMAVRRKVHQQ
jgi:hypothetical protein